MLAVAQAGPTVVVSGAVTWLILAGCVCTALLAMFGVWRKIVAPMLRVGVVIQENFPVWVDIASKFHTPEGAETLSTELAALNANQEVAAANQRTLVAQLQTVIAQSTTITDRVEGIDKKLSETRHDIIGSVAELGLTGDGTQTLVTAIMKVSEDLRSVHDQLAALNPPPPS